MLKHASSIVEMDVIKTERITLRPIIRDDAGALFSTLSDEVHCRYLSRGAFSDEE
jgi:hypothetical protein